MTPHDEPPTTAMPDTPPTFTIDGVSFHLVNNGPQLELHIVAPLDTIIEAQKAAHYFANKYGANRHRHHHVLMDDLIR